jgi:hypothetical protein
MMDRVRDSIRTQPRFARYPIYGLLLGLLIQGYWRLPLLPGSLPQEIWHELYASPEWTLLKDIILLMGPALVFMLGLVGFAQRGVSAKAMSMLALALGSFPGHYLSPLNLWQRTVQAAQDLWYIAVALPATMVYELSGEREPMALAMWVACTIAIYILLRRPISRRLRTMSLRMPRRA